MKIEDTVAIVTGGGQGIGRGIAHCLAEEGADIVIVDINNETAGRVADEINKLGRRSLIINADITESRNTESVARKTMDVFGKIDILVNNVGWAVKVKSTKSKEDRTGLNCADSEEEEWDKTFNLNAKSQFLMCRAIVPFFVKQKRGKIVNIGSRLAKQLDMLPIYSTAKAAVIHYTKHLAMELAPYNINVNCVCPGDVLTPNIAAALEKFAAVNPEAQGKTPEELFLRSASPRIAFHRLQTPDDIGRAVVFFASEDSRNISGQVLYVDGGQTFQ
ncbi:MAG: SDR family oxidoreductase [Syntrophales bacterium]|jgi:meso-butanediol dehydrogenase/(S,S)-butanediol dehydrogenase/diacetyl reductase|nr:SDR family oxidoreductase [Syntrophales bacterium]MDY0044822.1 SDR family oxidoreductase [Syntrophales bacterium]